MFRRLPDPKLRLLPVLWIFWLPVATVAWFVTGLLLDNWGDTATILMELRLLIRRYNLLLLLFVSPFAILLGSVHYGILRLMADSRTRTRSRREKWIGSIATLVMFSSVGIPVIRYIQHQKHLQAVHIGLLSEGTFSRLAKEGKYEELIDEMETACVRFDQSKAALGDKFQPRPPGACGICYLFTDMYIAWDSLSRLAPSGLIEVLQFIRHDYPRYDKSEYGPWRPIAEEMRKSKNPILHALGCFFLEDHAGFAESTYQLADSGNADYKPLAARAALSDPDPVRSVKRMLMYEPILLSSSSMNTGLFESTLIKKALTALQQGHSLSPHEARLYEIAQTQDMTPEQKSWFRLDVKNSGD